MQSTLPRVLAATAMACAMGATPAAAEISSVDAYGGEAAVLGKPPPHRRGPSSPTAGAGANRERAGEGRSFSGEASGSREESKGAVTGSGSGSGGAGNGPGGGAQALGKGGTSFGHSGAASGARPARRAPTTEPPRASTPTSVTAGSKSAFPLSPLDIVLILFGAGLLVGAVLLLRRIEPTFD